MIVDVANAACLPADTAQRRPRLQNAPGWIIFQNFRVRHAGFAAFSVILVLLFNGWLENGGTRRDAGAQYAVGSNAGFLADDQSNLATVTFYADGAIRPNLTREVARGTRITLPGIAPKPQYAFMGWKVHGTENVVAVTYTVNGDVRFDAQFKLYDRSPHNTGNPEIAAYYCDNGDKTNVKCETELSWLISPRELKAMLDDAAVAPNVIIWSDAGGNTPAPGGNGAAAYAMPAWNTGGAVDNGSIQAGNRFVRNEGPIANDHQVMNGVNIDNRLQRLGVTRNSIIVLVSTWSDTGVGGSSGGWWWYLAYWGFSKKNVKILDGGGTAYRDIVGGVAAPAAFPAVPQNGFSVGELPGDRFGMVRVSLGQLIEGIKSDDYAEGRKLIFSSLQNAQGQWFKDENGKPVTVNFYGFNYGGKMRGQKFLRTPNNSSAAGVARQVTVRNMADSADVTVWRYVTPGELKQVFLDRDIVGRDVTLLPEDLGASIAIWCGSGSSTMPYFVALQMAGYYNAGVFGGNSNGWFTLAAYQLRTPNPNNDPSITDIHGLSLNTNATGNYKAPDNASGTPSLHRDNFPYAYQGNLGIANSLISAATHYLKYNDDNTFSVYDSMSRPTGEIINPATNPAFYHGETWPGVDASGNITGAGKRNRKDLDGTWKWDVARYTDFITFNFNDNRQPHLYAIGEITLYPDYEGNADEIHTADRRYKY